MNAALMTSELWDLNPHLIPPEFRILDSDSFCSYELLMVGIKPLTNHQLTSNY